MKLQQIRITKEFNFEMAHLLWNYDGKCKNIHGHSYKMLVTIIGTPIDDLQNPKNGMVMDFGELKHIVNQHIISTHDHALAVNKNSPHKNLLINNPATELQQAKDYQPTAENMVIEFAEILKPKLPDNVKLHSIRLYETSTSFVEWRQEDNIEN